MSFIRRKRGQILLVHSEREPGTSRVRQRELARFDSAADLASVLSSDDAWERWYRAIGWREPGLAFDWTSLRERLAAELEAWQAAPSGATSRRDAKLARLVPELAAELGQLSLAKPHDAALVQQLRPTLGSLREALERLLSPRPTAASRNSSRTKESQLNALPIAPKTPTDRALQQAEQRFDEGMEHWWAGDRTTASRHFRRALKLDPLHAEALNHLGIIELEAGRLDPAEAHFRQAIAGAERHVEREDGLLPWGFLENRAYLRPLANLARTFAARGQWAEARATRERLLALDPDDGVNAGAHLGLDCLRMGDIEAAVRAFAAMEGLEPGVSFGLALARFRAGAPLSTVGLALLGGFAMNRYVAPMLLGLPWVRLDGWHGTNTAEPDWAAWVLESQGDLWHAEPAAAEVLSSWWQAPAVVAWMEARAAIEVRLQGLDGFEARRTALDALAELVSDEALRGLAKKVQGGASPAARRGQPRSRRAV